MDDIKLPDISRVRGSNDDRVLPPQASAEDTSNWDNRTIALPDPRRSAAEFILNGNDPDDSLALAIENPYLEQERLKSGKHRG